MQPRTLRRAPPAVHLPPTDSARRHKAALPLAGSPRAPQSNARVPRAHPHRKWRRGWSGCGSIEAIVSMSPSPLCDVMAIAVPGGGHRNARQPLPRAGSHPAARQARAQAQAASLPSPPRPLRRRRRCPLPRSCRFPPFGQAADQFARQLHIGLRARAGMVIDQRRKPVTRCASESRTLRGITASNTRLCRHERTSSAT